MAARFFARAARNALALVNRFGYKHQNPGEGAGAVSAVSLYVILSCGFYVIAKLYVRAYIYRPVHARPPIARHNEALRLFDLLAWTALLAGLFLLLNGSGFGKAFGVGLVAVLYDAGLRYLFLEIEVRRLRNSSSRWSSRSARRHVRRRAVAPMYQ